MPERWRNGSTCPNELAKVRLAEVAQRQWGVVSLWQLADLGIGKAVLSSWERQRRLHRIYPAVYSVGHSALGMEGRLAAALFYAGPGAALWGVTAGYWLGLIDAEPRRFHVCTVRRCRSLPDVRVHARRQVRRIWHRRLPVTPPAQTLLDIAGQVRFMQLRRALAEAEFLELVTLDEVEATLGRGRPGSAALRVALDCHRPQLARTKSRLEEILVLLCERYSVTQPELNVWIAGWLVDAVWFEQKVIVELDSHLAHGTSARLESDRRRDVDLRAAGYVVLRYTWAQLTDTPELVIADLRRALGL